MTKRTSPGLLLLSAAGRPQFGSRSGEASVCHAFEQRVYEGRLMKFTSLGGAINETHLVTAPSGCD